MALKHTIIRFQLLYQKMSIQRSRNSVRLNLLGIVKFFTQTLDLSQAGSKSIDLETTELHFNESSNVDYTLKVNEHEDCKEKKEELSLRIVE